MLLKHLNSNDLGKTLLSIIKRYLPLVEYKVFYFGSRVTGKGSDRSDIDVGIYGKKAIPLNIIVSIQEDVENIPTLYTIEVVDFCSASEEFRSVALQSIEEIK